MKLKDIIKYSKKRESIVDGEIPFEISEESFQEIIEVGEYFNEQAERAKEFVVERMKEEDFVRLISTAQVTMITSLVAEGEGMGLMLASVDGQLNTFVQTITMQMIGVLIDEEIL